MANPNIYTVGGTVQANDQGLYISRQADQELLKLCRTASFAYVLTPRQLGKSSLMIRTAEQLIEEGIQCAIVDISGVLGTQVTAEQWYKGLLDAIASQLMLNTNTNQWWEEHNHLGITQRLTLFFKNVLLVEVATPVVIFIDEIDTTLSLDFTDDFYAAVRYFHVARATNPEFHRLSFVLIGVATPGDLIRDPKRTPFNIGQRVDLTDFTFEEALPLAAGLGLPHENAQQVLQWVLKWTGGHPNLTQRLCRILADRNQADWSETEVDRIVDSTFFGNASQQDNNLQFVRDMLTKRAPHPLEKEVLNAYLQIYRGKFPVTDEEQSLVKSHLKLSGIVRRENTRLQVRNLIYRQVFNVRWIREHLPESLWQRLKPAMPLIVSLLIFSVAMAALATYAEAQRQEANLQRQKAEENAQEAKNQKDVAENQRKIALDAQKNAEARRKQAEIALQKVETAQKAEAKQRQLAVDTRNIAEQRRQQAEAAQKSEVQQRLLAVDAQKNAEARRKQAETAQKVEAQQRLIAIEANKVAVQRQQEAEIAQKSEAQQRQIAEQKTKEALARASLFEALTIRDEFPQKSLLLTLEAIKTWKFSYKEIQNSLRRLLFQIGGTPLIGHDKPVVAVAFSPKGNWLATGSKDGTVRLWDKLNPDKPAIVLRGNTGEVKAVAISPDSKWLAAISNDTHIRLWDITTPNFNTAPQILRGHSKPINALSFSPDGKWLATAGQDAIVGLWDMKTQVPGSKMIPLRGYKSKVLQVVFSPSGRWLATGESNNVIGESTSINVQLWNMTAISSSATPIILKTKELTESNILGLAFSPDEKRLAAAISYTVQVWDLTSKNLTTTPATIIGTNNGWISSIAYSPDGRWLATGAGTTEVKLWDMQSLNSSQPKSSYCKTDTNYPVCRFILRGHIGAVVGANFSPDSTRLATASQDGTARLWDITDLSISPIVLQAHEGWINAMTFDAEGQWLATASEDNQARLWKVPNVLNDPIILSGVHLVRAVAISPDRKWIASNSGDNIIRLWNTTDLMRPPILLTGHKYVIYSLAFSPNGKLLASSSPDGTVRLWDMTNLAKQPHILNGPGFWSMAFSSSGRWLAAGSYDGTVQVWDMKQASLPTKPSFERNTQNLGVRSLAFSPDEHWLVTGGNIGGCSDRSTLVWDLTNYNAKPISLLGHCDVVADVAFSPNNRWVAAAGWDGKAMLWDMTATNPSANPKIIKFDNRVSQVAFSPDGRWLAAGSWDQKVQLQDMNNLAKKPALLAGHRGGVYGLKFSPDNQWLASSSDDHTIRLWNPNDSTAAPIVLRGHNSVVSPLAFSNDSRWLLSGSDSDARLWRVSYNNDDLINIACRTAGRNLTPQEWQEAFGKEPYRPTCPNLPASQVNSSGTAANNSLGVIWQKFQDAIASLID
ncbi:WD-repeat protein [Calothrix sp. NIES-2100]|uniref:AAA-like domain-containing protein n=1 Tax=Calothrix sp. NIES-2100 TaxID=1954172 RepID=UPI000B61B48E|nr:WD-repeat protein [Calothrix sp. NIES-2100]